MADETTTAERRIPATVEVFEDRDAWLRARAPGIGASEMAAVLGVSRWTTPLELWGTKLGLIPGPVENRPMRLGKLLEPIVADEFARETGLAVLDHGRYTVARHPTRPYLICTLDREVRHPTLGPGVLECKSTSSWKGDEWPDEALSGLDHPVAAGDVPIEYWIQVQHQLVVTGAAWGALAVLIGNVDFRWFRVDPDPETQAKILAAADAFWRCVEAREEPAVVGGDREGQVLALLHPSEVAGATITLGAEALEWDAALVDAQDRLAKAKDDEAAAKNRFRQAIGDAEAALLPSGVRFSYKRQDKAGYWVEPSVSRVLRRKAPKA